MARRRQALNEVITIFTYIPAIATTDRDIRILVPGDATKLKHWKITKGFAGTGTNIIAAGVFSAAAGGGTRIMADQSIDIDAAVGAVTTGADATGDVSVSDLSEIFIFLNFDGGTMTVPPELTFTLVWQF